MQRTTIYVIPIDEITSMIQPLNHARVSNVLRQRVQTDEARPHLMVYTSLKTEIYLDPHLDFSFKNFVFFVGISLFNEVTTF